MRNLIHARTLALSGSSGVVNLDVSTGVPQDAVESAIGHWAAQSHVDVSAFQQKQLVPYVSAAQNRLRPKLAPEVDGLRIIFLPRFVLNQTPGTYLLQNYQGELRLYASDAAFSDLTPLPQNRWSLQASPAHVERLSARKMRERGFYSSDLPFDWSTLSSPVIDAWCRVLTPQLRSAAEKAGIFDMQSLEECEGLANSLATLYRPLLMNALQYVVHADNQHFVPLSRNRDATTPLERAAQSKSPLEREAIVQWLFAAPCFAGLCAEPDLSVRKELTNIVARREPFHHGAAEFYDCPEALIARLRRGSFSELQRSLEPLLNNDERQILGRRGFASRIFVSFLRSVPLSNIPEFSESGLDSQSWESLMVTLVAATRLAFPRPADGQGKDSINGAAELLSLEMLGSSTRGRWKEQARFLSVERLDHIRDANDFVTAVSRTTVLPKLILARDEENQFARTLEAGALTRLAQSVTLAMLARHSGINGIIMMSDAWHKALGRQNAEGNQSALEDKWDDRYWIPLVKPQVAPNGCRLVALESSSELIAEAGEMRHCVGGYATFCVLGQSHILSVRTASNKRLSTLELRVTTEKQPHTVHEQQHRSRFNEACSPEAAAAAKWLIQGINSGDIAVDWDAIAAQKLVAGVYQACGFNPRDSERWQKRYEGILPFLRGPLAAETPESFLEVGKFSEFCGRISQIAARLQRR